MKRQFPPPKAPPGHKIIDVDLRVNTFPLRGKIVAWLLWKTPLRKLSLRFIGPSPWSQVVAITVPDLASLRTMREKPLPAEEPAAIPEADPKEEAKP